MKEISDSRYFNMPILDKPWAVMTKEVETLPASMTLFDAASTFHKQAVAAFQFWITDNWWGKSRKDVVIAATAWRPGINCKFPSPIKGVCMGFKNNLDVF